MATSRVAESLTGLARTASNAAQLSYRGEKSLRAMVAQEAKSRLGVGKDQKLDPSIWDEITVRVNDHYNGLWRKFRAEYILTDVKLDQPSVKWASKDSSLITGKDWKATIKGRRDFRSLKDEWCHSMMLHSKAVAKWERMVSQPDDWTQDEINLSSNRKDALRSEMDRLKSLVDSENATAAARAEKANQAKLREERSRSRKAAKAARERVADKKVRQKLEAAKPKAKTQTQTKSK